MIVFHIGRPGSGKSYEAAAYEVRDALKIGRAVVTNMPLNIQVFAEEFPEAYNLIEVLQRAPGQPRPFSVLEDYERYDKWRGPDGNLGPLFIIDEASQSLPAAGRGKVPEEVKFWYEEHRHTGSKVVLITQQLDYVVKSIRNLADQVFSFKNMKVLGLSRVYVKRTFDGPVGPSPGRKPDRTQWRVYRRKWFRYYNSFTKGGGPVNEKVKPLWAQPKVFLGFLIIGIWLFNALSPDDVDPDPGPTSDLASIPSPPDDTFPIDAASSVDVLSSEPDVAAIRHQVALLLAQKDLEQARIELEHVSRSECAYDSAASTPRTGGGVFGGASEPVVGGCKLVLRPPPPPRHLLAGARVNIASTVSVAGSSVDPAVDILISRDGIARRVRTSELRALGWDFELLDDCALSVRGPWSGLVDCRGVFIPG